MTVYMQVAPETTITFSLYDKLCGMSRKFRDLFNKAKEEQPITPQPAFAGAGASGMAGAGFAGQPAPDAGYTAKPAAGAVNFVYCTNCGTKTAAGVRFCGNCGNPMS